MINYSYDLSHQQSVGFPDNMHFKKGTERDNFTYRLNWHSESARKFLSKLCAVSNFLLDNLYIVINL